MSFTAKLGTTTSQLGNIELGQGALDAPTASGSITAPHPTLSGSSYFRADVFRQSAQLGSTGSLAFSSNVLAGSTLVMAFGRVDNTTRVTAVNDTLGNAWVRTGSIFVGNGSYVDQWATFNIASGGANTVTISGTTGQMSIWELTLGPNAKAVTSTTGTDGSGTSHSTGTIASTGFFGCAVLSAQFTGVGVGGAGSGFNHTLSGLIGFFAEMGSVANFGSLTGAWTTTASGASASEMVMYTDVDSTSVGSSAGTATASATGFPLYSGGHILLETGDSILLETGDFVLLESTTDGGAASSAGVATVSGVGVSQANSVGSAAGVATVSGVGTVVNPTGSGGITIHHPTFSGTANTTVSGSGGITINVPSFSGSAQAGVSASGGITISHPTFSGTTRFTNPFLLIDQFASEDQEEADTQTAQLTQLSIEDIEEFSSPQIFETQFAVEDQEEFSSPKILLDQYCVEILIPFDCNLTPPLTLPPGCPPVEIEGTGSNHRGCEENSVEGTGSSTDGCVPFVKDI